VLADLRQSGHLDIAMVSDAASGLSVLIANGDGTFQPPVTYSVGLSTYAVAVGDVNGDGIPDLVSVNQEGSQDGSVWIVAGQ
jgi:hypothetical protein